MGCCCCCSSGFASLVVTVRMAWLRNWISSSKSHNSSSSSPPASCCCCCVVDGLCRLSKVKRRSSSFFSLASRCWTRSKCCISSFSMGGCGIVISDDDAVSNRLLRGLVLLLDASVLNPESTTALWWLVVVVVVVVVAAGDSPSCRLRYEVVAASSCCFRRVQLCCCCPAAAIALVDALDDDDCRWGRAAKTACRNKSKLPTSCCNSCVEKRRDGLNFSHSGDRQQSATATFQEKRGGGTWMATMDLACSWTMNWNDPPNRWAAAAADSTAGAAAAASSSSSVVFGRYAKRGWRYRFRSSSHSAMIVSNTSSHNNLSLNLQKIYYIFLDVCELDGKVSALKAAGRNPLFSKPPQCTGKNQTNYFSQPETLAGKHLLERRAQQQHTHGSSGQWENVPIFVGSWTDITPFSGDREFVQPRQSRQKIFLFLTHLVSIANRRNRLKDSFVCSMTIAVDSISSSPPKRSQCTISLSTRGHKLSLLFWMSTLTRKKSQDNRCRNVFLNSSLKKRRRRRKFSFAKAGCVFSTVASRYLRSKTRSPLRWFTCSLRCELFFLSLFFFLPYYSRIIQPVQYILPTL